MYFLNKPPERSEKNARKKPLVVRQWNGRHQSLRLMANLILSQTEWMTPYKNKENQ